jgi:endogenous inhibitor of DNA gyrase (YacG/DUF329 family)
MEEKKKPCPYCGKPVDWENNPYRPFCSERCKLIDLGNWATEKYRVQHEPAPEKEEEKEGKSDS